MSFQGLAQPAPIVEEAIAQAPEESIPVIVEPPELSEEPRTLPPPAVSGAVVGDFKKFAPKISHQDASKLSVATLREQGIDFESEAAVVSGRAEKNFLKKYLPLLYDERDFVSYGEVKRYIFVKGNCIFVYGQKTDPKPLYVIQLETIRAEVEDPMNQDKHSFTISPQTNTNRPGSHFMTVLLKDKISGKQCYQLTFDTRADNSLLKRFMDVIRTNAKHYGGDVVTASVVEKKTKRKGL